VIDVVLPVLDEEEALAWVLGRMPQGYRPIVVDNGSRDDSARVASTLGAAVVSEPRRGFGSACAAGLEKASSDVVCFMDADASLDPRDLPRVAAPVLADDADLVLGARRAEPGAWPSHARAANRVLCRQIERRTGLRLDDLGPMRAARRSALVMLEMEDRRFGWPLEMVLRACRAGWRVRETPVLYRGRVGRSKVTGTVLGTLRAVRDMRALLE
jgi:glycosyltransferase involved in cell wall biosynthesis